VARQIHEDGTGEGTGNVELAVRRVRACDLELRLRAELPVLRTAGSYRQIVTAGQRHQEPAGSIRPHAREEGDLHVSPAGRTRREASEPALASSLRPSSDGFLPARLLVGRVVRTPPDASLGGAASRSGLVGRGSCRDPVGRRWLGQHGSVTAATRQRGHERYGPDRRQRDGARQISSWSARRSCACSLTSYDSPKDGLPGPSAPVCAAPTSTPLPIGGGPQADGQAARSPVRQGRAKAARKPRRPPPGPRRRPIQAS